jgi:hypothetical protein
MKREIETRHPSATKQNLASRIVRIIWEDALRRSNQRARLGDAVQIDEETGSLRINLVGDPMDVSATTRDVIRSAPGPGPTVRVLEVHRFKASFKPEEHKPEEPLPAAVTAALMLAANVGFDQDKSALDNTPTKQNGVERFFVVSELRTRRMSYPLRSSWPLPAGYTLPFYAGFSCRWKAVIESFKQDSKLEAMTPDSIEDLAKRFLQLAITVLWPRNDPHFRAPELNFSVLADRVIELIANGGHRSRLWAAERAGLLAAPEFGLPASAANEWLLAIDGRLSQEQRDEWIENLRQERRARLDPKLPVETIFADIDEEFGTHIWGEFIEGRKPPSLTVILGKKAKKVSSKQSTATE